MAKWQSVRTEWLRYVRWCLRFSAGLGNLKGWAREKHQCVADYRQQIEQDLRPRTGTSAERAYWGVDYYDA